MWTRHFAHALTDGRMLIFMLPLLSGKKILSIEESGYEGESNNNVMTLGSIGREVFDMCDWSAGAELRLRL